MYIDRKLRELTFGIYCNVLTVTHKIIYNQNDVVATHTRGIKMQDCVVHMGIKNVGRDPSRCMPYSEYHKPRAPLFIPS